MNYNFMREFNQRIKFAEEHQKKGHPAYVVGNLDVAWKIMFDYRNEQVDVGDYRTGEKPRQKKAILKIMRNILCEATDRLGDIKIPVGGLK